MKFASNNRLKHVMIIYILCGMLHIVIKTCKTVHFSNIIANMLEFKGQKGFKLNNFVKSQIFPLCFDTFDFSFLQFDFDRFL